MRICERTLEDEHSKEIRSLEKKIEEKDGDYTNLRAQFNRFRKAYQKLGEELNELKQNRDR